jgi:hypothetical protein
VQQAQCCRSLYQEVFRLQALDDSFGTYPYTTTRGLANTVMLGCSAETTERHARTDDQGWVFLQLGDQLSINNHREIDQV